LFDCVYEANINSKYNERRYEPAIKCDEVKLTVVMTTYNRAEYIASAVQSILNQTYQQFHFIILDNCSTDHTEQVIKSINDSRIRYIKNEKNIGFVSNTNKAIELCETEYLSIVHDDDIFKSHFLETEMKIMEQNPLLSIVGSNRTYIDENGLKLNDMHVLNRDYIFKKFEYIKSGLTLCMPTIIYRMSFLLENNLKYSEELGFVSDSFFQYELNMMDTQIYFVAEPLIFYRTHKNQFSKQVLQVAKNRVTFSDKIYKKAKRDNIMWLMDYMIRYLENVLLGKLHNFDFDEEFVFELLKFADSKNIMKHLNYDTICFINLFKK
jgi:glycosyltransferase involved in cell wall biosynthesis